MTGHNALFLQASQAVEVRLLKQHVSASRHVTHDACALGHGQSLRGVGLLTSSSLVQLLVFGPQHQPSDSRSMIICFSQRAEVH